MTQRRQADLVGAIEAGGTHYRCALGSADGDILDVASFATRDPAQTLGQAIDFFAASPVPLRALGIAHFGPVDIDPLSSRYGHVLATPKPGWSGSDVLGRFRSVFNVPTVFQSDVNAAAIGEGTLGAAQGMASYVYVTIGTGIGGGVVVDGRLLQDMQHPELGHMWVGRAPHDHYAGCCPFHGDCLEGLAAGPALQGRWQVAGESLPPDHPAWDLQALYLARMCMNITLCYASQRIVLGGGAMQLPGLLARIQSRYVECMNGYRLPEGGAGHFICAPALQGQSALRGALILAGRVLAPAPVAKLSNGTPCT